MISYPALDPCTTIQLHPLVAHFPYCVYKHQSQLVILRQTFGQIQISYCYQHPAQSEDLGSH